MALFRPSPIIGAISGTLGHFCFKQTRNGPVISSTSPAHQSTSTRQLSAKARFNLICAAWHDLTNTQRRAWNAFSVNLQRTNTLGLPHSPTGFQTFMSHNMPALICSQSTVSDPPANTHLPPITSTPTYLNLLSPPWRWHPTIFGTLSPVFLITYTCQPPIPLSLPPVPPDTWPPNHLFHRWHFLKWYSLAPGSHDLAYSDEYITLFGFPDVYRHWQFRSTIWHPNALRSPDHFTPGVRAS